MSVLRVLAAAVALLLGATSAILWVGLFVIEPSLRISAFATITGLQAVGFGWLAAGHPGHREQDSDFRAQTILFPMTLFAPPLVPIYLARAGTLRWAYAAPLSLVAALSALAFFV